MNTSGDAADQVMRMMLNGTEVLIKLTGAGAKQTAILLYSVLRQQHKTSGAARLASMLRSGKPLKVYTFLDRDLEKFKDCAKEYGVLYTVLKDKDKTDGVFDVMVKAEDAAKISRICERFKLVNVNAVDLKTEVIKDMEKQAAKQKEEADKENTEKSEESKETEAAQSVPPEAETQAEPEQARPTKSKSDREYDELFAENPTTEKGTPQNPTAARTESTTAESLMTEQPQTEQEEGSIPTSRSTPTTPSNAKSQKSGPSGITSVKDGQADPFESGLSDRKTSVRAEIERIRKKREDTVKTEQPQTPELPKIKGTGDKGDKTR